MLKVGQNVNLFGKAGLVVGFSEKTELTILGVEEGNNLDPCVFIPGDNCIFWVPGNNVLQGGTQEWHFYSVSGGTKVLVKDDLPGIVIASNSDRRCRILYKAGDKWAQEWFPPHRYEITEQEFFLLGNEITIREVTPPQPQTQPDIEQVKPPEVCESKFKKGDFVFTKSRLGNCTGYGFVVGFLTGNNNVSRKPQGSKMICVAFNQGIAWVHEDLLEKQPLKTAKVMFYQVEKKEVEK